MTCPWAFGCCSDCCCSLLQDRDARFAYLEESVDRLKSSIQFGRADPAPMNALGDALVAKAELLEGREATDTLQRALEEGYRAAQNVNRQNAGALVSCDAQFQQGLERARCSLSFW